MFDKPVSWGELITIVLFLLGAALIFYLILAVANLVRILKNVNRIVDRNKDNINQTIEKLPKIASNAEKITESIKNNMEGIDKVVQDVSKISASVKKGVETVQKDILSKAKVLLDIVAAIKGFFEKKKKSSTPKKKGTTVYKYKYKKDQEKPEEVEILTNEEIDEGPYEDYIAEADDGETEADPEESPEESPEDASEDSSAASLDDSSDVSDSAE